MINKKCKGVKRKIIMKNIIYTAIFIILCSLNVYAQPRLEYGDALQTYIPIKGPQIISYSENWDTCQKLEEIYNELLNNFHSEEIDYLASIYIYPDSPDGINGAYYESSTINNRGRYSYGNDSYIELFNGNEYDDVSELALTISHEYGHHFTFYYLITSENKYYNEWYNTQYAKIRQLDKYKEIDYGASDIYMRQWDITEILAFDYVQLFGSELAKKSFDFKDITERINENIIDYYTPNSFNLLPQENLILPLAADVDGLYEYWLNLAGYHGKQLKLPEKPIPYIKDIEDVYYGDNKKYTIAWTEVPGNRMYEYTLIIYPSGMPFFPTAVKTTLTGEIMEANIGSEVIDYGNGEVYGFLESLKGEYEIRVFVKDEDNFIFSSETLFYDFTTGLSGYNESTVKNTLDNSKYESTYN